MPQSQDDIRQAYNQAAENYAKSFLDELTRKPRDRELLSKFAALVDKDQVVLDLGCGPGHTTAYLASLGVSPIGIDLSPGMIDKAKSLFPNVDYEVGDFFHIARENSSVGGILGFYCIVHLTADQLVPAFREMLRVLCNGGVLFLAFHIGSESVQVENFLDTEASLLFYAHVVDDVQLALQEAGFANVEVHVRPPYDSEYPSNRAYVFAFK